MYRLTHRRVGVTRCYSQCLLLGIARTQSQLYLHRRNKDNLENKPLTQVSDWTWSADMPLKEQYKGKKLTLQVVAEFKTEKRQNRNKLCLPSRRDHSKTGWQLGQPGRKCRPYRNLYRPTGQHTFAGMGQKCGRQPLYVLSVNT